jgi:hypothetical protein
MPLFRRLSPALLTLVVCLQLVSQAAAQPPPLARVAVDESLRGPAVLESWLDRIAGRQGAFPVTVRLTLALDDLRGADAGATFERLDQRLALYARRQIPVWLALELRAPEVADVAGRTEVVRRLSVRAGARVALYEVVPIAGQADVKTAAFVLKQVAVELRAGAAARIAIGGLGGRGDIQDARTLEALYREDIAPYIDGVVFAAGGRVAPDAMSSLIDREDPGSFVALAGVTVAAPETIVGNELDVLGQGVKITSYTGDAAAVQSALTRASAIADLLSPELVRLDPASSALSTIPSSVRSVLLYDTERFGTTLVYARETTTDRSANELEVRLTLRTAARPSVRDPFTNRRQDVKAFERDEASRVTRIRVPLRDRPLILDFGDGLADAVNERTNVEGATALSVGEIVARHQQARAVQDRALDAYVARVRMQQHFRPTSTDPGFDVVTDNRYFSDRAGVEWAELSFSVNGTKWGPDRPPFPLLQPEKVLAPPLDLGLTADYRYRLEGTATVAGSRCYVVRFEPVARDQARYHGTVWIDAATFQRVKLQATQTALSAPVVSNEEVLTFAAVGRVDEHDIYLPVETVSRQIVLIAGRNILVEKTSSFREHELNPSDFLARRVEARRGEHIMYRDTDRGIRYFVKEGDSRVVSDRATTKAKAMAIGATIDPSYGYPLPMFGINYLDFEFGGRDSQLAVLFAGVLALGNLQRPKLAGTPLDGSVDFFAIAVPSSDRLYDASGEREAERVLTWPLSAGANLGYQFTSFQKVSAQYQFRFDGYLHDRTTADDYVPPSSTMTHGVGAAYEYRRGGYSVVANGTWFGRASWEPWGTGDALVVSPRTYTKYSLGVTKEYFLSTFSKLRVNAAYFGGRRLDRFSQYQFGLFDDTRIHGVPSSGVRFGELAMLRGSYSFNVFEQYRVDVFLEGAVGRDRDASRPIVGTRPAVSDPWEPITGLGTSFSLRVPWSSILRADVGKSFLPDRYGSTGSVVVQVMLLKPL